MKKKVVGRGEVLREKLPERTCLGGAPAKVAYITTLIGDPGIAASCVGQDSPGLETRRRKEKLGVNITQLQAAWHRPTRSIKLQLDGKGSAGFLSIVVWSVVVWSVAASAAQNPAATPPMPAQASARNAYVGNQACAPCHSAIYESYQRTSMAQASGPAIDGFMPAEFTHKNSGVHYRIYKENGRAWLSYDRPGILTFAVRASCSTTSAPDAAASPACLKPTAFFSSPR
jgi:hypothetical protein